MQPRRAVRRRASVRPLIVFMVLLAACGGGGAAASSPAAASPAASSPPVAGAWLLVGWETSSGAIELPADWPITIRVDASSLGGQVCNEYGARIVLHGAGLQVAELFSTEMACGEPAGIMELEAAYLEALATASAITVDDRELVIATEGAELRYEPLPTPPTSELVDTEWVLETIVVGDVAFPPDGDPATLVLDSDGTFSGSTGCRSFSGQWIERGHQIDAPTWGMDEIVECPLELAEQDGHVVSVIGDGFVPTIEDRTLTLSDPDGTALVYRAAD